MTVLPMSVLARTPHLLRVSVLMLSLCAANVSIAQEGPSLEELELQVEQQRIALEEAIANREATAAKAAEIEEALDESEERRQQVADELKKLCDEQEVLNPGSLETCMSNSEG